MFSEQEVMEEENLMNNELFHPEHQIPTFFQPRQVDRESIMHSSIPAISALRAG
jgi:hypothetical protein